MNSTHRKHRRRRQDRPSLSAQLVLDDQLAGDIGIISDDLWDELFNCSPQESPKYVALAPWTSAASNVVDNATWTVIPVHSAAREPSRARDIPRSTIIYPASSGLPNLDVAFEASKTSHKGKAIVEIRVLDVVPVGLQTLYVSVDTAMMQSLEQQGNGYVNGHSHDRRSGKKEGSASQLQTIVRKALSARYIVRTGDPVQVDLMPNPITHMLPPPARITNCEPVAQGLLLPGTRIVLTQESNQRSHVQEFAFLPKQTLPDDEISDDRFYSADESKSFLPSLSEAESEEEDDTDSQSAASIEDLSDDSLDEMIGLNLPKLGPQTSIYSAPDTPQAGGKRLNGITTPGSVLSAYSTSGAGTVGKIFRAQSLLQAIPNELLFPRPPSDEDEEIRVFVDVSALIRIGCFSGDWVRLETASKPGSRLSFDSHSDMPVWRAVKAYGLPDAYSSGKHLSNARKHEAPFRPRETPRAYLSPILLANLDSTSHIKLSALAPPLPSRPGTPSKQAEQIAASSVPPAAKEVTLIKVSTPISTDRQFQQALLARLKKHFEDKRRVVKSGDLVGLSIDDTLARAFFSMSMDEDSVSDEVLGNTAFSRDSLAEVAWFRIGDVRSEADEHGDDSAWGGIYSIDPSSTRMVQAGSMKGRMPANTWEYYLNVRKLPTASIGATAVKGQIHPSLVPLSPYISTLRRRLRELMSATTNPRALHLGMSPTAVLLTSNQRGIGKSTVARQAAADVGLHALVIDVFDILTDGSGGGDVKTEAFLKARSERAFACGPENCVLIIKHIEGLTADRMIAAVKEIIQEARITIATSTDVDKIPDGIRALFTHEVEQSAPNEGERQAILREIVDESGLKLGTDVDLGSIAVKTAALVAGDLLDVVERAVRAREQRIDQLVVSSRDRSPELTTRDVRVAGGEFARCVVKADFETAVEAARKNFADSIGAPKIPNVPWDEVGGLTHVKEAVVETIQLPLERPELFAKGMKKRSGILFYGPPGTGKTLLAKAIATEFSLNFFSVKGPELLNMYIGESEANVRRVFQRARDARPCVVFFDELDSVAPKRGNQGDSGGVMDRIVSQLLAELDGMSDGKEGAGGVFVIGATNRPDLLDQALLRPGRFDKMLYLGVSDTHAKQLTILEALTKRFSLHPDLSLERVAKKLPFTYTGADLYALCSDAMLKAITRQATAVDNKIKRLPGGPVSTAYFFDHFATKEDTVVMVTEQDFTTAQEELVGSVSATELEHYSRVRATFEEKGEPAK